ncbi:hypothetical protein [Flavobacterium luteum]|uniref:hypothetical protein n=1 Tax=Flavobacterium luteum TaxID=2026654 RepID=UPI001782DA1B|nr:hypothetical protein [Flavobacterium luteum]
MNDAHLHLIVNHFPIIGTVFGLGILISGMILKNNSVKTVAYVLFIVAAIFAAFSMGTGEGAEELVEDMPNVGKQIIHDHEELAEGFAILLYVIGFMSLISIYLSIKKNALGKYSAIITLVLVSIAVFLAKEVGTSGGEIRHTEIRPKAILGAEAEQKTGSKEKSDADND